MAHKTNSSLFTSVILILSIFLVLAASEGGDEKQPEWLIDPYDGSTLIPGFGRIMLPPLHDKPCHGHGPYNPFTGTRSVLAGSTVHHVPRGSKDASVPYPIPGNVITTP